MKFKKSYRRKPPKFVPPVVTYAYLGAKNKGPFEFHIDGICRINAKYASTKFVLSKQYDAFKNVLKKDKDSKVIMADEGEWQCSIIVFHPRKHVKLKGETGRPLAQIDIDAGTKGSIDALEKGGIVDNDARIVKLVQEKIYDPSRGRRTHIRLDRLLPQSSTKYEPPPYESG